MTSWFGLQPWYVALMSYVQLLPFLRKADLEKMGVIDAEALLILQAVKRLQDGSNLDRYLPCS